MTNIYYKDDLEFNNEPKKFSLASRRILLVPLLLAELFFGFTIILYLFGPTSFEKINTVFLLTMLILYNLAFSLGYLYEIKKNNLRNLNDTKNSLNPNIATKRINRFIKFMILAGLLITTISTITYASISSLSPTLIIQQIINSINNPMLAYSESFSISNSGGAIYKFLVITAPISWAAFPLSAAFFKKLPITFKILTGIMFFLEALRWIIMGRNKGVFDIAIIISVIFLMEVLQSKFEQKNNLDINAHKIKPIKTKSKGAFFIIILILIVTISYFTNTISSRNQYYVFDSSLYESQLMKLSPEFLHPTLIYLTGYLTQGYHAFSMLIEVEWTPMFGIGNSMFLISKFSSLFGHDFFQYTYQTKLIPKGIDSMAAWHSFYTWVANDVHWLGVIIIMFLIGEYFAFAVKRNIVYGEIISYPITCLMFIILFYMSGNNQVFSQPNTFVTFWFLSVYWFLIRNKIVFTKSVYGLCEKIKR